MLSKDPTALKFQLDKTIQLSGDRAGGQGNFDFAGLAELQTIKVVLLKGNPQSLEQPADWRRFHRLLDLAERIQKPVLLWNLLLTQNETLENPKSLELGTTIKITKMQLLKLPQPIISVYDETIGLDDAIQGVRWSDGIVVVKPEKEELLAALNSERQKLKIVCEQADIPKMISNLLEDFSRKKVSELVSHRLERVHYTEHS